jgi:hypothetical protein
MRRPCRIFLAALLAGMFSLPVRASADGSAEVAARAQALFEDGKRLMADHKFAEACPKLAESERLDPAGGTQLALGLCHEGEGKTASAWADFNLALTQARRDGRAEREQAAQEHIRALDSRLTKVAIAVTPQKGIVVTFDGTALGDAEWGLPLPVDPGQHTIGASAPGAKAWSTVVDVRGEGKTVSVSVPTLEQDSTAPPVAPTPTTPPTPAPVPPAPTPPPTTTAQPDSPSQTPGAVPWRTVGLVTAGVGVVGIGVGSVFGVIALSNKNDAEAAGCVGDVCPSSAASKRDDARNAGNVSTIFFVAGGVLAAAGVTIWLLAPRPASAPTVGLYAGGSSVGVRGAW